MIGFSAGDALNQVIVIPADLFDKLSSGGASFNHTDVVISSFSACFLQVLSLVSARCRI